jgi:hypothetical protein
MSNPVVGEEPLRLQNVKMGFREKTAENCARFRGI